MGFVTEREWPFAMFGVDVWWLGGWRGWGEREGGV